MIAFILKAGRSYKVSNHLYLPFKLFCTICLEFFWICIVCSNSNKELFM